MRTTSTFSRRYPARRDTAEKAGMFAHAATVATLRAQDWQFGQDVDDAARDLVAGFLTRHDGTFDVRVNISFDQQTQRARVEVSAAMRPEEAVAVLPRRPFQIAVEP